MIGRVEGQCSSRVGVIASPRSVPIYAPFFLARLPSPSKSGSESTHFG